MEGKNKRGDIKKMVLSGLFAAIIAVLSQIAIPMPTGVSITLQTLAIALCGFILGKKHGTVAVAVYVLLGAVGLPVFTNFSGGLGSLVGITGGFIWGFIPMAFFCGLGSEKSNKTAAVLFGILGLAICHIIGTAFFAILKGGGFFSSALLVSVPYLLKDVISIGLAYAFSAAVKTRLKVQNMLET